MSEDVRPTTPETPPDPTAALPNDPVFLQQMIVELLAALRDTRRQNEELQHRLDLLLRRLYGPRTERLDPNQPLLIPDAFEPVAPAGSEPANAVPAEPEPDAEPKKKPRPHGRKVLPKDLPRVPRVHELTEAERRCPECGESRVPIGAERSEQLDYQPASLFVVEHVRCTYACPHCEGQVVTADKPAQPIPKGLPGPGLLAHVITEKYADHIPLHRQERRLARQGVELSRSTLCDWMAGAAKVLEPLYDLMSTKIANFGFGEVLLVVKGTLIVVGSYYVQSLAFATTPVLVGIIMGLLSSSALYVNQFPDFEADKKCGRRNLVVRLGLRNAARAYVIYPVLSFSLVMVGVLIGDIPLFALFSFVALPLFYKTSRMLTAGKFDTSSLFPAMTQNVLGARIVGIIVTLAYLIAGVIG